MKCSKCGFISNRDFYRCPYCGHTNEEDFEGIRTRVNFGHNMSAQIRTIVIIFVVNLFVLSFLVDWYLDFKYAISLWSFFILFGSLTVVDICSSKKGSLITSLEKLDVFLLCYLLLACGLCKIQTDKGVLFDARAYFPALIIPSFLIISCIVSTFVIFFRKSKMRPLFTELLFIFHFAVATILFAFMLTDKYCIMNHVAVPFKWLLLDSVNGEKTPSFLLSQILIFTSFGFSLVYLVNFNIVLVGSIFRKVKRIYGGERD